MVAVNEPLGGMTTDAQGALYMAALERKLAALTINEMRYRTLLEMLTGEPWEEINTDITKGDLMKVATTATHRRLARSMAEAEAQVKANIEKANEGSLEQETS